jgi:hypothetical protein
MKSQMNKVERCELPVAQQHAADFSGFDQQDKPQNREHSKIRSETEFFRMVTFRHKQMNWCC